MSQHLELLAPAGTKEVFEAAVNSGADAVYIGAPMANARALAKHFTFEEIAALVSFAHSNNVKVYVAMNSLVKNDELAAVVKSLSIFDGIGVDAIIIQDLGIYAIARQYFPNLRLHASTLLGAHNSIAVKKIAEMGFARIVLAREMDLSEIQAAALASHAEIEIFVQGAMCFSYSGLCLASSFLGGKSGLRGRCVQPCRRKYTWKGKHKGSSSGYFFSMNDLNGIALLDKIKEAGVNSLKIEGRMRSRQYIENVVKAYRLVIDEGSSPDTLATAEEFLKCAMGRKTSAGFFSTVEQNLISAHHSGNIGLFMGKISQLRSTKATLTLHEDIAVGDRLRINCEGSGDRKSFTIQDILIDKNVVSSAMSGTKVTIDVPDQASVKDPLYKVDTAGSRAKSSERSQIKPKSFHQVIGKQNKLPRIAKIISEINTFISAKSEPKRAYRDAEPRHKPQKQFRGKQFQQKQTQKIVKPSLPLWLTVSSFMQTKNLPREHYFERIIVLLSPETLFQFKKSGIYGLTKKIVCWALPPIIQEKNIAFYREAISFLSNKGFTTWQVGHFSQVGLFDSLEDRKVFKAESIGRKGKKNKKQHRPRFSRQTFLGNYTLNGLNTFTFKTLAYLGLKSSQIAIEADRDVVKSIATNCPFGKGLTVYGYPALLTARASLDVFKTKASLISPKGEPFQLKESNGVTQVIAQQPFSLLGYLDDLKELGVDYGVIDLCNAATTRDQFTEIGGRIAGKHRHRKLSTFNYNGSLL